MKNIKDYLNEGLITRKVSTNTPIRYRPQKSYELQNIIIDLLNKGITDLNCIDVSDITNMCALFYRVRRNTTVTIKDIDISKWDTSNVTDMHGMFDGCKEFNADLSNWDVSNVKFMSNMFYNCNEFNSDLSKWNVSNVTDMSHMFDGCESMTYDLSTWNVSQVNTMKNMFEGCTTLEKNNKIPAWYDE